MLHSGGPGLYEFLIEAELQQYYSGLKNDLKVSELKFSLWLYVKFHVAIIILFLFCFKVQHVAHLKYVAEQDLHQLGMSKPEVRRLKKYFLKHFPQNYFTKFKKVIGLL